MQASLKKKQEIADILIVRLRNLYPTIDRLLNFENPWQLLLATMLSAQCTDKRVNLVTPALFLKYPNVQDYLNMDILELEEYIKSTGFYKNKAKNILECARIICADYTCQVPADIDSLVKLPGIGRKTANVILSVAFKIHSGIAVDTHVLRIANRLALTKSQDAVQVEKDLMCLFVQSEWGNINNRLVRFGRDICIARKPKCLECCMNDICISKKKVD